MDKQHYTVTVVIAAPGTPLYKDGKQDQVDGALQTSGPGHMFFVLSDGGEESISYGFAPIMHGQMNGPRKNLQHRCR